MKKLNMPLKPLIKEVGNFLCMSAIESTISNNFNSRISTVSVITKKLKAIKVLTKTIFYPSEQIMFCELSNYFAN